MPKHPTSDQRLASHLIVGIAGAIVGSRVAGVPGIIVGAILPPLLHQAIDAPLATVIADAA